VAKDRIATTKGGKTSVAGVFAAGDAATGPDNIIGAVAGGYEAAAAADRFLSGDGRFLDPSPELTPADKEMVLLRNRTAARRSRVKPELRSAGTRKRDFDPCLKPMTEAEAIAEAARCLRCGCSETCGLCHRVCSSFAISLEKDGFDIAKDKCHACGLCAQLCPNKNIEIVAEETAATAH
jgi:NADPH-dependent glutamate synthase beta subunit-like oxidoreductase